MGSSVNPLKLMQPSCRAGAALHVHKQQHGAGRNSGCSGRRNLDCREWEPGAGLGGGGAAPRDRGARRHG